MPDLIREDVIAQYGWQAVGVFKCEEEQEPSFNYTIGLMNRDWPELIMVGMRVDLGHYCLAAIIKHYEDLDRPPELGEINKTTLSVPIKFGSVSKDNINERMTVTRLYANRHARQFDALQVIWSDMDGNFPDSELFDMNMRKAAVILGETHH